MLNYVLSNWQVGIIQIVFDWTRKIVDVCNEYNICQKSIYPISVVTLSLFTVIFKARGDNVADTVSIQ